MHHRGETQMQQIYPEGLYLAMPGLDRCCRSSSQNMPHQEGDMS
jgi:hypothetical protein